MRLWYVFRDHLRSSGDFSEIFELLGTFSGILRDLFRMVIRFFRGIFQDSYGIFWDTFGILQDPWRVDFLGSLGSCRDPSAPILTLTDFNWKSFTILLRWPPPAARIVKDSLRILIVERLYDIYDTLPGLFEDVFTTRLAIESRRVGNSDDFNQPSITIRVNSANWRISWLTSSLAHRPNPNLDSTRW